ncbi:hypothetical protein N7486_001446 [Penicillium sp. IBT 16267x]|nr:hypothetical protein N7486_001446 [Penicillium sp. IBT 16267x]
MVTVSILAGIGSLIIGTNAQTCALNKYYCGSELLSQVPYPPADLTAAISPTSYLSTTGIDSTNITLLSNMLFKCVGITGTPNPITASSLCIIDCIPRGSATNPEDSMCIL